MIINSKTCYCTKFSPNRNYFLEIINAGELSIECILQYNIYGGLATKDSGILNPGQHAKLCFQSESTNICFNILNHSLPNTPLICHGNIPVPKNSCCKVTGTAQNPLCTNVPCY